MSCLLLYSIFSTRILNFNFDNTNQFLSISKLETLYLSYILRSLEYEKSNKGTKV